MYTYANGWMRHWRGDGDLRIRIAPSPVCEQWWAGIQTWVKLDPGTLWMDEVEDYRNRSVRKTKKQPSSLLLPGLNFEESVSLAPKASAAPAADRIWREAPEAWWEILRPIHVHPWRCLEFLHTTGSAGEDLFRSNPGLAWLLACRFMSGGKSERAHGNRLVRDVVRISQRDQLKLLGLPTQRWMAQMLRKLEFDLEPRECLKKFRTLVEHEGARKAYQHLDRLPGRVLSMIEPKTLPEITPSLANEVVNGVVSGPAMTRLLQGLAVRKIFSRPGTSFPRFTSAQELENWLQTREREAYESHARLNQHGFDLPPPPFPGNDIIIPIQSRVRLHAEGRDMHHCVATFTKPILAQKYAAYEVIYPVRATLGIRCMDDGTWVIHDFRLKCNKYPSGESWAAIRPWLKIHGIKTTKRRVTRRQLGLMP